MADTLSETLSSGTPSGDFRLCFGGVDQDNTKIDAEALTLRSRFGCTTGVINNYSATLEFEDVRVVGGMDNYSNLIDGNSDYSEVAVPEVTEVDQAFIKYKTDQITSK
jgi:hypothetical protein